MMIGRAGPGASEGNPFFFGDPAYSDLGKSLTRYGARETISCLAGLLTVPEYHPETLRIEVLLHLAVLHCRGKSQPSSGHLSKWLETVLARQFIRHMEDPPEDVFISNVIGPGGNYRIFEGIWEVNDYYLQGVLDCISRTEWAQPFRGLRRQVMALLALSERIAERRGLERWRSSERAVPETFFLRRSPKLAELTRAVTFTTHDLSELGITPQVLAPFLLTEQARALIQDETLGHTTLERYPLLEFEGDIVFACPTAASACVRRHVLEWLWAREETERFTEIFRSSQRRRLDRALRRLSETTESLDPAIRIDVSAMGGDVPAEAWVRAVDCDKPAHIVFLHDDPDAVRTDGLGSTGQLNESASRLFRHHLATTAQRFREQTVGGLTLVVLGGLGRGIVVELPKMPAGWHLIVMKLPDLESFASCHGASLLRLFKLHEQLDRAAELGVEIPEMNGPLNQYAYWASREFHLIPDEFPYPGGSLLHIGTNFVHDLRASERARNDVHAVRVDPRHYLAVVRLNQNAFFETAGRRPVYASWELAQFSELVGVVEGESLVMWVFADPPYESPQVRRFTYDLWEATLGWLDRALPLLEVALESPAPPIQIRLSLIHPDDWTDFSSIEGVVDPGYPELSIATSEMVIELGVPLRFLVLLNRPTNDAERILLEAAIDGITELLVRGGYLTHASSLDGIAAVVARDTGARSLHLFHAESPPDQIQVGVRLEPRLVQNEDWAAQMTGLAWDVVQQRSTAGTVEVAGRVECGALLKSLVDVLWRRLQTRLEELDATSIIKMALENSEAISRDRDRWRRTARAMTALHAGNEDVLAVSARRESDLAITNHASRILVEMAVPTCRAHGGRVAARSDLDTLLAGIALLLELAADADAIQGGVAKASIQIFPNGTVVRDHSFLTGVASPYVMQSFTTAFNDAIATYERLYNRSPDRDFASLENLYENSDFANAFRAEYGISPSRVIDAFAELWDLAHDAGVLVPTPTRGVITQRLIQRRRFSEPEVDAIFDGFALTPRERWDFAPPGFRSRDWMPWKFRRRLSVVTRPIVALGSDEASPVLFGAYQIGSSLSFLMESIQAAALPVEFFTSAAMRKFRGSVAETLGHAFTADVEAALREMGWESLAEVEMRTLGAPKEYGDVDVLAWKAGDARILVVECKRLQPARALGEIVERLNEFRGESLDRLGRHLRRAAWVRDNLGLVRKRIKAPSGTVDVVPLLVTNIGVPMQFTADLALPPSHIMSLDSLRERLGQI